MVFRARRELSCCETTYEALVNQTNWIEIQCAIGDASDEIDARVGKNTVFGSMLTRDLRLQRLILRCHANSDGLRRDQLEIFPAVIRT
jgi:hypothetical protein